MQVSAINSVRTDGYSTIDYLSLYNNRYNEKIGDTSFNSLTSNTSKKGFQDNLPYVFDSVNQWKNFCHKRILGGKLNIIA